ncbi:alpha/beta hydrolase [Desulfobacterales bacterium HSG2]|nr:alpha/beta hydrolase [Desulfobacterales bacterium HSG2]
MREILTSGSVGVRLDLPGSGLAGRIGNETHRQTPPAAELCVIVLLLNKLGGNVLSKKLKLLLSFFGLLVLCFPHSTEAGDGDVNGSGNTDLSDVVITLQVCAGLNPTASTQGGEKIGLKDAIFALQVVAGLRILPGNPSLENITLGGIEQWILIQSNGFSKPILLVLHGGPGFAMMPLFHEKNRELEDHFIVVNWDQRGAGRSYSPNIPKESMTLAQLLSDAHELTGYLKDRFDREKIFIVGHSFGTILGIFLVRSYPDDYLAFGSVGQVVDVIENEQLSYDFALSQAVADNNASAITELEQTGRPDEQGEYADDSGYEITMKWVSHYGGEMYGKTDSEEIEEAILNSEVYANHQEELINGWTFSQALFDDENVWQLDFRTSVAKVDVPVYFFTGRHDYDTPFKLVEQYYEVLNAPTKEIIWFENSAHFPFYEEAENFNKMIIAKFLNHISSNQN